MRRKQSYMFSLSKTDFFINRYAVLIPNHIAPSILFDLHYNLEKQECLLIIKNAYLSSMITLDGLNLSRSS